MEDACGPLSTTRREALFQLTLLKEDLLSEEQILFQAGLGVHLDEAETKAFAFACREGSLRPRDVRAVTGLSGAGARAVLDRLAAQTLISPLEGTETPVFVIAEHLRGRLDRAVQVGGQIGAKQPVLGTDQIQPMQESLSTAQVGLKPPSLSTAQVKPLTEISATHRKIMGLCDMPCRLAEIMNALGVANRGYFKKRHIDPLLRGGVLRMTRPDQPNHPDQAYVLTEAGVAIKALRVSRDSGERANGE